MSSKALRLVGADMIIGVDLNSDKKAWGKRFGMTHFVNPKEIGGDLVAHLVNMTKSGADQIGGADYTFECVGNVNLMRAGARKLSSRLGPEHHHRRRRRLARRSRPGRFSSSPAGCGAAVLSAAPAAAPTCQKSSIGTCRERSRSIR